MIKPAEPINKVIIIYVYIVNQIHLNYWSKQTCYKTFSTKFSVPSDKRICVLNHHKTQITNPASTFAKHVTTTVIKDHLLSFFFFFFWGEGGAKFMPFD